MFMTSAALGGLFAMIINQVIPSANVSPGAFALVAMGAVFGASARATFTFIVFAFELTRDYNAVLPLMLVSVIADAVAIRFLPNSIMTEKLARRGVHMHHEYEAVPLKHIRVAEIMDRSMATVAPEETIRSITDRLASGDARLLSHHAMPIVDSRGQLLGIATQGDILRALEEKPEGDLTVLEAGNRSVIVGYPDESAFDALTKMLINNVGQLPIVNRNEGRQMVGYINRAAIMSGWSSHLRDESVREEGWLSRFQPKAFYGR